MKFPSFNVAKLPQIIFGAGKITTLPDLILQFGAKILLVTGSGSFKATGKWDSLAKVLGEKKIEFAHEIVHGEPTPEFVDEIAAKYRKTNVKAVVAIGGGSAIDAGKAISAMIPETVPVVTLMEGVGTGAVHKGQKVPFIAIPTTAGTGSEATKNAVLRHVGSEGFKNSLRHDNLVPDIALIDPELQVTCPASVTAACGLDAFTQLLESYTSTAASPFTDALALSGMEYVQKCLFDATGTGAGNVDTRAGMAYGALLSGITLANAGLGIVHGLASPIGGFFEIPHGVVCGTVLAVVTRLNIEALRKVPGAPHPVLEKYANVGRLWTGGKPLGTSEAGDLLIRKLEDWVEKLRVPRLGTFGVKKSDVDRIVAKTSGKNNPIALTKEQIKQIVQERL